MSVVNYVFLRSDRLPTHSALQQALDAAGTGIVLESVDDLRAHTGYWPAQFRGHESGFEWSFGPVEEMLEESPAGIGDRDAAVMFSTFSDMRELACALYVAGILAKMTDGVVLNLETGDVMSCNGMLQEAKAIEEEEL